MKTKLLFSLCAAALLAAMPFAGGCSHEVSHTESDKPGWFGGRTHTETTVTEHPNGTVTSESSRQTVR
jgi:hypothetical protein